MAVIGVVILFDLLIKKYIASHFGIGQTVFSIKGFLIIAKVEAHSMSYGWKQPFDYFLILTIILQVLFLVFFIRMIRKKADRRFIIFSLMIIAGWTGNYFDKLFFSTSNSYQQLDYLNFPIVSGAFTNLSALMSLLGWILLIFAVIFKFGDFKKVFTGNKIVPSTKA